MNSWCPSIGPNISMQEDFPRELIVKRNQLAPIMITARNQEMKAFMIADKVIINGKPYTVNNLNDLPDTLDPSKIWRKHYCLLWRTVLPFKL